MCGLQEALVNALKDGAGNLGSAGKFATEGQRALEIVGITCKQYLSQHGVRRLFATVPDICACWTLRLNRALREILGENGP